MGGEGQQHRAPQPQLIRPIDRASSQGASASGTDSLDGGAS
jgi:hypothetical protein